MKPLDHLFVTRLTLGRIDDSNQYRCNSGGDGDGGTWRGGEDIQGGEEEEVVMRERGTNRAL